MALRTPDAYRESLRDGRRVFFRGEQVPDVTRHPVLRKAVEHAAIDYELAEDPDWQAMAVVQEPGEEPYHRFFALPRGKDDLLLRMRLIEETTRRGGTVVTLVHEIGSDALFALLRVAARRDRERGPLFLPRVEAFYRKVRGEDAAMAVAQTDLKGDRRLPPSEQPEPDTYVHVVRERDDGIVVRGAKAHTSVSINSNYLIVLPSRRLEQQDEAFAIAFWLPVATEGLTLVGSPYLTADRSREEAPLSSVHKMMETLTLFDDVFVPWENVFLYREPEYAGPLARAFVEYHRFTAVSYKLPLLDLLVGVAAEMAEANGIATAGHVREKLLSLVVYATTVRHLLEASTARGFFDEGLYVPDPLTVNLAKYHFAQGFHTALRDVQDIVGGLLVTAPSPEDRAHPELGPFIERLYQGAGHSGTDRLRLAALAQDLAVGELAGYHEVLAVHAEGSIEAEKIEILRRFDFEKVKADARRAAGIA